MQARGGGVDFLTNSYSFHSKFFFGARKCHKNVFDVYASSSKKFMLPWVLDKLPFKVSWVKKWIIGQKMHTLRQMSWLQNYAGNVHVEETFWYAKWNTAWLARLKSLSFQQIIFFFTKEPWGFFLNRGYGNHRGILSGLQGRILLALEGYMILTRLLGLFRNIAWNALDAGKKGYNIIIILIG